MPEGKRARRLCPCGAAVKLESDLKAKDSETRTVVQTQKLSGGPQCSTFPSESNQLLMQTKTAQFVLKWSRH